MKYFRLLEKIEHGEFEVRDIFKKYILDAPIDLKHLFTKTMMDHETLESVALDEYGDPELYWVLVIINDIRDVIFDLPLPDIAIQEIARAIATDDEGNLDIFEFSQAYDELQDEQDQKRKIKVLKSKFINVFLSDALKNKPE
jgi:hypothetical protein